MSKVIEGEFLEFLDLALGERKITVYLPREYPIEPDRVFSAVFVHDGDFLFTECIEVIEANVREGLVEPVIFIGIDSEHRNDEYTPWEMDALHSNWSFGGKGDSYLDYVYQELVPNIQNRFRISREPKDLTLGGVSLGGLISLYAMYREENTFGNFILISASVWFKDFIQYMQSHTLTAEPNVYMYVGEQEGVKKTNAQQHMVPNSKLAYGILRDSIADSDHRIKFETDVDGTHDDHYFIQYFPNSIKFLYAINL